MLILIYILCNLICYETNPTKHIKLIIKKMKLEYNLQSSVRNNVLALEDTVLFTRLRCQLVGLLLYKSFTHQKMDIYMTDLKAFKSKIHAFTQIRHRNIVKFYGFISFAENLFLVWVYGKGKLVKPSKQGQRSRKIRLDCEAKRY